MRRSFAITTALGAVLIAGLTGCSSEDPEAQKYPSVASPAQRDILSREQIGFDEYKEAFANYVRCTEDAGYVVGEPILNPMDGRTYLAEQTLAPGQTDVEAVNEKAVDCNPGELGFVQEEYLKQNPPQIDAVLLETVRPRLDLAGISTTGTETRFGDFFVDAADDQARFTAIQRVFSQAIDELFPGLPYVDYGY
ncbi:hypothetical protein M2390_000896 [Mycetocola sp. BIGb0189]|uniref:hypothetical protein n=1 Tax=Mycetocola sp. BIGb0189 TaxID=2940604 RepID=UPI0021687AA0|nr:hypothetical protein [Mycetocola sp. BIGb0189]MCS4275735.1 hypothetical protein [Mycetocola sp. BIGb0189]